MKKIFKFIICTVLAVGFLVSCGDDEEVITLNAALTNVTAESDIELVTLSWDIPANNPSTYLINYTPGDVNISITDVAQNTLEITELVGETEYTFTLSWLDENLKASEQTTIKSTPTIAPPGTFNGNLTLRNQEALNTFELEDKTAALVVVNGDLTIISDGTDDTWDLSVLSTLTTIKGNLVISGNPILSNLTSLSSLTAIEGGDVTIQNNRNLVDLCGLSSLAGSVNAVIDGNGNNPTLAEILAGTCKTQDVLYDNEFDRFNTQAEIDALPDNITHFIDELIIGLDATTNDITDLSKFSKLREVGGRVIIQRSPFITDLTGFRSLEAIGTGSVQELVIRQMDALTTLNGLQALRSVSRRIGIRENPALTTLEGLNNIHEIGENTITIGSSCSSEAASLPLLTNYCAITGLIERIGIADLELGSSCVNTNNAFNPSLQDILDGNCSE